MMRKIKTYLIQLSVVVLGVLIAFGIDQLNENRIDNKRKKQYLEAIHESLLNDNIVLDSAIIHLNKKQNLFVKIDSIQKEEESLKAESAPYLQELLAFEKIKLSSDIYESMLSSGSLDLINNFELKNKIVSYYNSVPEAVDFMMNTEWEILNNKIIPIVYKGNYSYNDISPYLTELVYFQKSQHNNFLSFKESSDSLIVHIEKELNK